MPATATKSKSTYQYQLNVTIRLAEPAIGTVDILRKSTSTPANTHLIRTLLALLSITVTSLAKLTTGFVDLVNWWLMSTDAERECLQVDLMPLIKNDAKPMTCKQIQTYAFQSHVYTVLQLTWPVPTSDFLLPASFCWGALSFLCD